MARTALTYAKLQLDGGEPWGEMVLGECSLFVCRKCRTEYRLRDGCDPCAFCDDCKSDVLDILAAALVAASAKRTRRHPNGVHSRSRSKGGSSANPDR